MQKLKIVFILLGLMFVTAQSSFASRKPVIHPSINLLPEYAIFRVEYAFKKTGFEMKIFWEKSNSKNHSLATIVDNVEDDGVKVIKKDGSIEVIRNEVDLLNALVEYGWRLKETFTIKIMSNEYQTYILIKE